MSPIFQPDFSKVDAGFPVYDKGLYRVKVTKRTPFVREKKDETGTVTVVAGVRYALELVGKFDEKGKVKGDGLAGKSVSAMNVYIHTDGGMQFAKPFLMATAGYNPKKDEAEANEKLFQGGDWTFDGESDTAEENIKLGSSWDAPVDRIVDVFLSKKKAFSGEGEEQEMSGWMPVK